MKKIVYITILTSVFFGLELLTAQDSPYDLWLKSDTKDFKEIQNKVEDYFSDKDKGQGSGYKQWKRWEYMNEHRLMPDGSITNYTLRNWEAYQEYLDLNGYNKPPEPADVTNGSWYFIAPTNYTSGYGWNPGVGRVNCITFHPTDPNTYFIGTPAGGMWKTTNDGSSWTNLCNGLPSIGISGIAIDPGNTNHIYILTGDGDGGDTKSIGILETFNGGTTWEATGLSWGVQDEVRGYKLRMHPTNHDMLFAVTSRGIYKSADAGATWANVKSGWFFDIAFNPANPSIMYATRNTTFWRSTDTGSSWTQITSGVPTNASRTQIGVSPSNPNYVYLLCGPATANGYFVGVYLSYDAGLNFYLRSNTPNILGYSTTGSDDKHQTTYDLAIVVSRTDHADIMTGGINTWISTNYGTSWTITSWWSTDGNTIGYTHADIHALEINPLNNHLYCASDGGIFKSTNFGNTWTDLTEGVSVTQWYRIAGYEPNPNLLIGGTQDNGCNKWTGGSLITHILGADGMDCMIDPSNPDIMYYSSQGGDLHKSMNGGASAYSIKPASATGSWVTPFVMNPQNPVIIYGGYDDVYKSTSGGLFWTNVGVDGRGAMAIGIDNPNRIYAANGNTISRSDNAGGYWYNMSSGLPGHNINFIAVNPDNSLDIFITLSGFNDGEKVYRSTTGGTSWTNITGSLPNIIVMCIAYEDRNGSPDDALYIGTDVGVFYRNNSLGDWMPFSNWLPVTQIRDLEINEANNIITAATHGRGLWRSQTFTSCETGWTFSGTAPQGYSYYQASDWINTSRVFDQGIGQEGYNKAGNSINLLPGFKVANGSKFKAFLGPCTAGVPDNSKNPEFEAERDSIVNQKHK
ncbi:MAG: hypothetical protein KQI35_01550 [Bacteroidetes bacterium]|nr:hypothetical protein [Bacteroidota bacterium]